MQDLIRAFANLFNPVAPQSIQEGLLFIFPVLLLTPLVWYLASMVVVWFRQLDNRENVWKARTLIGVAYLEGALVTALLWTVLVAYCLAGQESSATLWVALIPHWLGLIVTLVPVVLILFWLRRRVRVVANLLP